VDAVTLAVKELHSYDVPESIAVDIQGGNQDYLQWVRDATASSSAGSSSDGGIDSRGSSSSSTSTKK